MLRACVHVRRKTRNWKAAFRLDTHAFFEMTVLLPNSI